MLFRSVDDLTQTLIRYRRRMSELDRQIAYLESLRENVDSFIAGRVVDDSDAAPGKA